MSIWKDIRACDVQYINGIFCFNVIWGLLYGNIFQKPMVLSPRGCLGKWPLLQNRYIKYIWLNALIKPFVRKVVWHATSEHESDEILEFFPNSVVQVVPNGIALKEYKSEKINRNLFLKKYFSERCAAEGKIIVSIGRLHKKKGFDILIRSFLDVLAIFPGSYLLIAGEDGGEQEHLLNIIDILNLHSSVCLVGDIRGKKKNEFLANANLFVLPSHHENFGNVYLESLACGTPIVASTNTPWEVVDEYRCGKWVGNDTTSVSEAIIEMLGRDPEEMRLRCLQLASHYEWTDVAKRLKKIFLRLHNGSV